MSTEPPKCERKNMFQANNKCDFNDLYQNQASIFFRQMSRQQICCHIEIFPIAS